ncbi:rhomboid family intramembrane serine protease [Glaciecola sp. MH2013]|uniref:rhomboid family intramembrane serine protease n=1 Tax=Glaciecola sp. MH2013 TaxID=2785524 RepID=UPI00189FA61A|nr:rhomboid family intramembrane serine protease [Glaciecola sp. MH2013]MBF7073373.1 rhomboid family intramembrane serine protease [Glaciecola sp. MH2013]
MRGNTNNWINTAKKTPLTSLVLVACVLVYCLSYLGAFDAIRSAIGIRSLGELSQTHQWWRLLGPVLIHFSVMHIVFNLIWWWILGSQLERIFGTVTLSIIFVVSALASNIAQLVVHGPNFGGLNGVVYALFGFVWWIGFLRPQWGIGLPNNLIIFMLAWLALGYLDILWVNMANEAHLFGLISGCVMALISHQIASL